MSVEHGDSKIRTTPRNKIWRFFNWHIVKKFVIIIRTIRTDGQGNSEKSKSVFARRWSSQTFAFFSEFRIYVPETSSYEFRISYGSVHPRRSVRILESGIIFNQFFFKSPCSTDKLFHISVSIFFYLHRQTHTHTDTQTH